MRTGGEEGALTRGRLRKEGGRRDEISKAEQGIGGSA